MLGLTQMTVDYVFHRHQQRSRRSGMEADERNIEGLIVLITGANSGLGKQAALELSKRKAKIIMACRNVEKAEEAKADILKQVPEAQLTIMRLDLGDLDSVREFAHEMKKIYTHIDILINNAGISQGFRDKTKDGFEANLGVNHLGPFLLTLLLLELLQKAKSARIVCVSSSMQYCAQLNTDDLMMENSSMGFLNYVPYSNSKMANGLFTRELAKRLEGCDSKIKTYSLCPGIVETDVFRHDNWYKKILTGFSLATVGFNVKQKIIIEDRSGISFAAYVHTIVTESGAETTLHCALAKSLENETGKFYRFIGRWDGAPVNKLRNVDKVASDLWDKSEDYVGLPGFSKTNPIFQKKSNNS